MSYKFDGRFDLNVRLDDTTFHFLKDLNSTRRMKRIVDASFGIEGEFYVNGNDYDSNVADRNKPPKTQPSLFCPWVPTKDRMGIEWDGKGKATNPVQWIEYLVSKILSPKGYMLNGEAKLWDDTYYCKNSDYIEIQNNVVNGKRLITDYSINKLLPIRRGGQNNSSLPAAAVKSLPKIRQISSSKSNASVATKTRKQTAKENREEITRQLEAQVLLLQDELAEKNKEIKRAAAVAVAPPRKKLSVQNIILEKLRGDAQFGGTLDDFKLFLKNLLV